MRIRSDKDGMILISPGMKARVITRSENFLAEEARKVGSAHYCGAMSCNSSDLTVQTVSE